MTGQSVAVDVLARAILVIDMCGYRQLMANEGVRASDAAVARLQEVASAATEHHGGRVVKFWADNVMAIFPTVRQAVGAAEATMALVPCAAGVGFGEIEDRGDDLAGLEVCDACGLGEDEAERGCVLLTPAAEIQFGSERALTRPEPRPTSCKASQADASAGSFATGPGSDQPKTREATVMQPSTVRRASP